MRNDINTLYIDFDGVIVATIDAIVDLYNEDFQYYNDFKKVNWWEIDTWDFEECNCTSKLHIDSYFNQPRFFERLKFMPYAKEVIEELSKYYKIKIVSHGYSPNLKQKELWIKSKLPFTEFIGVNLKDHNDKSHINMSDGLFIDDSSKNLVTSNAKECICFGDEYSWNKDWTDKRMMNWIEIKQYLLNDRKAVEVEK